MSGRMQTLIDFTDAMLKHARNEEWDSVIAIQARRDGLLAEFFVEDSRFEDEAALANAINHILEVDKEIMVLGGLYRDSLKKQLIKLKQGNNAVKAYRGG
ncbi:MAG: flagellar protein FliT [Gammaproteobacteria bacterium]